MSAELAKQRLFYIVALDRLKMDGRDRIARLYRSGNCILFDKPLTILPDETLQMDYTINKDGDLEGHAIITKEFN